MTSPNYDYYLSHWKERETWHSSPCIYGIVYSFHLQEFRPYIQAKTANFAFPFNTPITIYKNYHYIFFSSLPSLSDFSMNLKKLFIYVRLKDIE